MRYFRLEPDVVLHLGARAGALYAIGLKKVLPLTPDEAGILRQCEQGVAVECLDASAARAADLLDRLAAQRLGRVYGRPIVVDRYLHASGVRVRRFYEPPLALAAVYLQLTTECDLTCDGCGTPGSPVWQGCNACHRWPGVRPDARWSRDALDEVVDQLVPLQIAHAYVSGGNPLREEGLLNHLVERLGRCRRPPQFMITTPGVGLSRDLARWAAPRQVSFNVVLLGPDRESYARACGSADAYDVAQAAIDTCRSASIKFYLTLHLSTATPIEPADWRARAGRCGAASVVLSYTMAGNGGPPPEGRSAGPLPTTGRERVPQVGPGEMHRRQFSNHCLDKAIAVCVDRRVRACPMIDDCLGDLAVEPLSRVFAERRVDRYWKLTKDGIQGCRQCEFRYACVDCTAVDLRRASAAVPNPLCDYDPIDAVWRNGAR